MCGRGAELAYDNADRLIACAFALKDVQEYGAAQSLLVLAAEELTKAMVLFLYSKGAEIPTDVLEPLLFYHSARHNAIYVIRLHHEVAVAIHEAMSNNPALTPADAENKAFEALKQPNSPMRNGPRLWSSAEARKQRGFYVDFNGTKWLSPSDVCERDLDDLLWAVGDYAVSFTRLMEAIQHRPDDGELIRYLSNLLIIAATKARRSSPNMQSQRG